jgi:glycosyltransferase involved in cell wall biosynthesis
MASKMVARRILLSAYACEPHSGSEPGAGYAWLRAAAEIGPVALFTRTNNVDAIVSDLERDPTPFSVSIVGVDGPAWLLALKRRLPGGLYFYYALWQQLAARRIRRAPERYDVFHHVTFASDWLPAPTIRSARGATVWGPVGGSTSCPKSLRKYLSIRAQLAEAVRDRVGGLLRRVFTSKVARAADLVLALNGDTGTWASGFSDNVHVLPNAVIQHGATPSTASAVGSGGSPVRRAVYAGRLVEWKGLELGLRALAKESSASWALDVYGDGPARSRFIRTVRDLGLESRVRFLGQRPREEVLAAVEAADAFLFPSLHDSAPWSVAEAVSFGTPVVGLALGGLPVLTEGARASLVEPSSADVVEELAAALASLAYDPLRAVDVARYSHESLVAALRSHYESLFADP